MRKRSGRYLALALLGAAFTLQSCGGVGNSAANSGDSTDAGDGSATITFWTTLGHDKLDLINQQLLPRFYEETGNKYTINVTGGTDYDSLYGKIKTALSAGTQPTMAFAYPDHAATYLGSDSIVALDDYVTDPEVGFTVEDGSHQDEDGNVLYGVDDFVSNYWEEGKDIYDHGVADPSLYTVPFFKSTEVMYYNKTFLDAYNISVPKSFAELMATARTIQEKDGNFTGGDYWPVIVDSDSNLLITASVQNGWPYTDPTAENPFLFDNAQTKGFVKELYGYHKDHLLLTKGSAPNESYSSNYFTDSKAIFAIGSSGGASFNKGGDFEIGVAQVPYFNADNIKYIQQGPSVSIFRRATAAQKKGAWLFYKFISRTDVSLALALSTGYDPVRISSLESAEYTATITPEVQADVDNPSPTRPIPNDNLLPMVSYMSKKYAQNDYFYTTPAFVGSAEARDAVGGAVAGVLTSTSSDIDKTIDEQFQIAMADAVKGLGY